MTYKLPSNLKIRLFSHSLSVSFSYWQIEMDTKSHKPSETRQKKNFSLSHSSQTNEQAKMKCYYNSGVVPFEQLST